MDYRHTKACVEFPFQSTIEFQAGCSEFQKSDVSDVDWLEFFLKSDQALVAQIFQNWKQW